MEDEINGTYNIHGDYEKFKTSEHVNEKRANFLNI
jgi:hypothetical protein